ncbi:MAG TPA: S8 family peptidase [Candidatus Deferrimicrobium sp.]|nr:S8 family peptidase [Candidatus Deferrimicrobium sp.]
MPKEEKFFPKVPKLRGKDTESTRIGFYEKLQQQQTKGIDTNQKAIIFVDDPVAYAKEAKSKGLKVVFVHKLINAVTIETTSQKLLALSDEGIVTKIWEDMKVQMFLHESVPLINAPQVWETGPEGQGILVAIVDTGVDGNHPDLKGKLKASADFTEEGYFDGNGHGTHVAGTVCGTGAASNGKYKGVAPKAELIAAKVLDSSGSGTFSGVIAGVEWATEQKPHVMNLSLGANVQGSCDGTDPTSLAVDAAMDKGIVVCVAAGNAGPGSSTVGTPGCAKKVITVGASDKADQIAWFSSRGPTLDGRVKPDLLLPGVNIIATRAKNTSLGQVIDEFYTQASGTSMATPHCVGVAALMLSADKSLTPSQIKQKMMQTAKNLNYDPNTQGAGRVDAYRSCSGSPAPPPPPPTPVPGVPMSWQFQIFLIAIAALIIILIVVGLLFST